jgi:hypothetical protein
MLLIRPLSVYGQTPRYTEALPEPTQELCGDQGVYVAVGTTISSLIYRGVWDSRQNQGSWHWAYRYEGNAEEL